MRLNNLFFKLNMENEKHKYINEFFQEEPKKLGISKISMLYRLIRLYIYVGTLDKAANRLIKVTRGKNND